MVVVFTILMEYSMIITIKYPFISLPPLAASARDHHSGSLVIILIFNLALVFCQNPFLAQTASVYPGLGLTLRLH